MSKILGAPTRNQEQTKRTPTRPDDRIDAFTFPAPTPSGAGTQLRTLGGLTKREHFAGLAMQALARLDGDEDLLARRAASYADALIAALNITADDPAEA